MPTVSQYPDLTVLILFIRDVLRKILTMRKMAGKDERRRLKLAQLEDYDNDNRLHGDEDNGGLGEFVDISDALTRSPRNAVKLKKSKVKARERVEGVFVVGKAVRPCTVCLLPSQETSLKFADLAPHCPKMKDYESRVQTQFLFSLGPNAGFTQPTRTSLFGLIITKLRQTLTE